MHAINWFEIPTTDLDRATRFYEQMLACSLRRELFDGTPHAVFAREVDSGGVSGALISDGKRKPSSEGAVVYLSAPDLDGALGRVAKAGGQVLLPKTSIGAFGFMALVRDSEGNVIGLHTVA